jgi:quercetin dioxygenase-like cupin family protein
MSCLRGVVVCGLLLGTLSGCAARRSLVIVDPLVSDLDALLASHPLVAGQQVTVAEIGRSASASYHLVQVAGGEQPHRHRTHDLAVFVLRGRGTLTLGERRVSLHAGDAVIVPRDHPHWFRNEGDEASVTLAIFTPPLDAPDNIPEHVPESGR